LTAAGDPRPSQVEARGGLAGSAVLAPLYVHDGRTWVILTRRTMQLRSHKGQVSFPGGRQEAGESLVDAALRESQEEIGLDPSSVELIGELDHLATISSASAIVPFVGVLPGPPPGLRANPSEVDRILHVPLDELTDPGIYRCELWPIPEDHPIFFFELVGDTVWGATAAMLRQLLGLATGTLGRGDLGHR
jgi:8-oxo-dGTP pyrophosphatase MutT (NUDIX family)